MKMYNIWSKTVILNLVTAKNKFATEWDLSLVDCLLWRALRQNLYRQWVPDTDYLKCFMLHC